MVSTAHTDSTLPTRMNARRAPRRVRASEAPGGCISRGTRGSVSRMYGRAKPKPRLPSPSGSGPKPAVRSSSLTKMARVSQPPGSSRSARAGGTTIGRGDNDLRTACGGTPLDQECKVSSIYKGAGPAKANTHRHTTRRGANACSRDQGRGRGDSGPIPTAPGHPGTAGDLVEERASRRTKGYERATNWIFFRLRPPQHHCFTLYTTECRLPICGHGLQPLFVFHHQRTLRCSHRTWEPDPIDRSPFHSRGGPTSAGRILSIA